MIARYKKDQFVDKDSASADVTQARALSLLRYATQITTASLSSILRQLQLSADAQKPTQGQLDKDIIQQVHKLWKDTVSNNPGILGDIAADKYSKIGPFQEILRIYRDIKNSTATRQDRILAALREQSVKAWQNTQEMSSVQGLPIMYGVFV